MQVTLEQDENGDLLLPLPQELLNEVGWKTDDVLTWTDNEDGTYTLSNKQSSDSEYVLVDCVRMHRVQYMVKVPAGKTHWALDSVALEECAEFSNDEIGTNIVTHRTLTAEQAVELVRQEYPSANTMTDNNVLSAIATWSEQQ